MRPVRKYLFRTIMLIPLGVATIPSHGQFFWLGFQAGEGVTWFSNPGKDSVKLSAGAGTSFGFFARYGTQPYFQITVEWLFSTNQMKFEVKSGKTAHDNLPFHNFKIPLTAGYEVIHKPRFKWRVGGGMFIGSNVILQSNSFNFSRKDIRNPQFGLIGETGIQYLNFLVMFEYDYSINRFFSEDAETYGYNVRSHLQSFSLKVGMQF